MQPEVLVNRRGLGKMKHLEIKNMWIQKEVRDKKLIVFKINGTDNPADVMTKILNTKDIVQRLTFMKMLWVTLE